MLDFFKQEHSDITMWIISAAVFLLICATGFLLRKYIAILFQKILGRLGLSISDEAVASSKSYIFFWSFLLGLYCAFMSAPINHKEPNIIKAFFTLFAFSVVILSANMLSALFKRVIAKSASANIIKFIVIIIGVLLILSQIGIKLTPILTALGIGSLAVALALQDTLANFFAGMHILIGKHIVGGDYIKLDSGQEGTVVEIGWRATTIREISNVLVMIPNVKITTAIISKINNDNEVAASVSCGVSYDSDLEKVEKIALEAVNEVLDKSDNAVKTAKPALRYSAFGDSSINFVIYFKVKNILSRGPLVHAVVKNIKAKFVEEGIEIPFPQRVVHLVGNEVKK